MNKWTHSPHMRTKEAFSQLSLFSSIFVILYFVELLFSPCLSSARLPHLFATVPILWGHHFTSVYFLILTFSFC